MFKILVKLASLMFCLLMLILTFSANNINAQLVTNGSFEDTEPGPVTGNDIVGWVLIVESGVDPLPDFEIVDDTVQHGNRALKIVVNAIGSSAWSIQVVADSITVESGTTYRYSIWAKTENPGSQANFTVGNYDFNEYGFIRQATLSDEWKEFTFEFTITDQETYVRGPIHFSMSSNIGDIIYIDNLRIIGVEKELASRYPIIVEADSGEIGSDFAIQKEGEITYIQIQTDGADFTPAIWDYPGYQNRAATYEVTFIAGGTYNLFARIRVGPQKHNDDSFFYANGFGIKDTINAEEWIVANQLQAAGFSDSSDIVHDPGGLGEGIWKWINLSQNSYHEPATTFTVEEDSLTVTFQIGGRETGLDIDCFAFGRADLYYTVGNLENVEPGSEELPGKIWKGPPLATGHTKFLGCAYSTVQAPNFESYWNQVTPENDSKWRYVEGTRDVMNWSGLDVAYNFAKENGFPFRFHVLIYGDASPGWIESLPKSEQLEEIEEWFATVAERYSDIDYLEVVNEPLHNPPDAPGKGDYIDALGGSNDLYGTGWDWIIKAFELARQYFPDSTKLMINDYNILRYTSNTTAYLTIIDLLQERELIDGIGFQAHGDQVNTTPVNTLRNNLNSLAATGLFIQVMEMDVDGPTDQVQITEFKRVFPLFWENPAVVGITLWGWRPPMYNATGNLLNNDGTERPALAWLRDYVQSTVSIDDHIVEVPQTFKLYNNYPNPFNLSTNICYHLHKKTRVTLNVFDIMGRHVHTLVNSEQSPGQYTVTFNASNFSSGIYFYRLSTSSFVDVKQMLLMK